MAKARLKIGRHIEFLTLGVSSSLISSPLDRASSLTNCDLGLLPINTPSGVLRYLFLRLAKITIDSTIAHPAVKKAHLKLEGSSQLPVPTPPQINGAMNAPTLIPI